MAIGCAVESRRGLAEEICGGKEKRFRHMESKRAADTIRPTKRRVPLREMAPPRSRRRDQPRASGERRSAATMRRDVPADKFIALEKFF